MAHPGGRPTKYNKAICNHFEDNFREGQSVLEVAVSLGVTRSTLYEWAKVHPEFSDALTRGREVSQAWWEAQGRENLIDTEEYDADTKISTKRRFNDRLWNKNVSCRFRNDWADRVEVTGADGGPIPFTVEFVKQKKQPDDATNQD